MLQRKIKNIVGIRHGEALHNIVAKVYGDQVYEQFSDTTLTVEGMRQAVSASPPPVDLVLVSPLTRTLQTSTLMFPNVPTIALECLKEYPQEIQICNRRSVISVVQRIFPTVDFSDCVSNKQKWPNNPPSPLTNIQSFYDILETRDEVNIAVVTHSSWLKYFLNGNMKGPELEHCYPYILVTK